MRFSPVAALLLAGCAATSHSPASPPPEPLHAGRLGVRDPETLVVVLHDDGEPGARSDEQAFARAAAAAIPDSAVLTILRPGHADAEGHRSAGERGADEGGGYGFAQIDPIADRIARERGRAPKARVVLVGEGGGAALAADIAGLKPGTADAIVLVGCPCALPEWRSHMGKRTGKPGWRAPVASLDPLKAAGGVPAAMRVAVLVGAADPVTPPKLSRAYAEALALRGIATDYRILPGKGHDLLNDPEILTVTAGVAARLQGKP